MKSCVYEGQVRHRRLTPREHEFSYSLFLMYLDLDELPRVFRGRWLWSARRFNLAWFRRADHLGDPRKPLIEAVRERVARETGRKPLGPVRLLTHLRYMGFGFNPVSFYYCFDAQDRRVETIVCEVNNTPWGEQHVYVLPVEKGDESEAIKRFSRAKAFHVSPFMPMDIDYDWRFSHPGDTLSVHMENHRGGAKLFDATLRLSRKPLTSATLARILLRHPMITAKVVAGIYYQALRLWLKKIPFHPHPGNEKEAPAKVKEA